MTQHEPRPDDVCPRPDCRVRETTQPLAPPIYPTSVWICNDTEQADRLLGGLDVGYVYQRDGHPNADLLAEKVRQLHAADHVTITSSGMSALSLAVLAYLAPGDHVVASDQLYGRSRQLLTQEAARWGVACSVVDTCDVSAVAAAITDRTRLVFTEIMANPTLRVADVQALAELAHRRSALLMIDNTFATPVLCRPLQLGADLVMESVSKMMNGHSDVMLGLLAGRGQQPERIHQVHSAWGLASSPFECWLASRGLASLHLRIERACSNALQAARFLHEQAAVAAIEYPGLPEHPQHRLASHQFGGEFGTMVTFHLEGGRPAADAFIARAKRIPFCPSLGETCTTLSHPESTSHRSLPAEEREKVGISGGTIRLSVGVESPEFVLDALREALG